jgi:hypothetical protein
MAQQPTGRHPYVLDAVELDDILVKDLSGLLSHIADEQAIVRIKASPTSSLSPRTLSFLLDQKTRSLLSDRLKLQVERLHGDKLDQLKTDVDGHNHMSALLCVTLMDAIFPPGKIHTPRRSYLSGPGKVFQHAKRAKDGIAIWRRKKCEMLVVENADKLNEKIHNMLVEFEQQEATSTINHEKSTLPTINPAIVTSLSVEDAANLGQIRLHTESAHKQTKKLAWASITWLVGNVSLAVRSWFEVCLRIQFHGHSSH